MDFNLLLFYVFLIFLAAFIHKNLTVQFSPYAFAGVVSTWEHFEPNSNLYFPGESVSVNDYNLLRDVLKGKKEPRKPVGPNSQTCYEKDFYRTFERAGDYSQKTNNYIHSYPDSCSAPNHDLILNFYEH